MIQGGKVHDNGIRKQVFCGVNGLYLNLLRLNKYRRSNEKPG